MKDENKKTTGTLNNQPRYSSEPTKTEIMTTDTPRTDAEWASTWQTERRLHELCLQLERELAISLENQLKTQAEVKRLRAALQSCYWATNTYDGNYTRACDNVATIAIQALKTQDL